MRLRLQPHCTPGFLGPLPRTPILPTACALQPLSDLSWGLQSGTERSHWGIMKKLRQLGWQCWDCQGLLIWELLGREGGERAVASEPVTQRAHVCVHACVLGVYAHVWWIHMYMCECWAYGYVFMCSGCVLCTCACVWVRVDVCCVHACAGTCVYIQMCEVGVFVSALGLCTWKGKLGPAGGGGGCTGKAGLPQLCTS